LGQILGSALLNFVFCFFWVVKSNTSKLLLTTELGFKSNKCDLLLFTVHGHQHSLFVLNYEDDIIVTRSSIDLIQRLIAKLNSKVALKHLGTLYYFLRIEDRRLKNGFLLLLQATRWYSRVAS
jgi:hypothetical protein